MVRKTSSGTSLPFAHGFTSFASSSVRRISEMGFLRLSCFIVFALHRRFFRPPRCTRILRVVLRLLAGFLSFEAGGARCTLDFLVCFLGGARTRLFFLAPPNWPGAAEAGAAGAAGAAGPAITLGRDTAPTEPGLPALVWGAGVVEGACAGAGAVAVAPPDWNAPPIFLRKDPILEIFIAPIAMAGPGAVSKPPVCGALVFLVVPLLFLKSAIAPPLITMFFTELGSIYSIDPTKS